MSKKLHIRRRPCVFCRLILAGFLVVWLLACSTSPISAATKEELKEAADKKAQELELINNQVKALENQLEETQGQSQTLEKEISKINREVKQLDLSIRSSEITIEKLKLEIEALTYDIGEAGKDISFKKAAIAEVLRELQRTADEMPLAVFLKNSTLAESFLETQSLNDLNSQLSLEIAELKKTKNDLDEKLGEEDRRKEDLKNETTKLKSKKTALDETKESRELFLRTTKNQEKLYQKSIDELEKKQAEVAAEIEKIEAELRAKIDPASLPLARPGVLGMPAQGRLTQEYGITSFTLRYYRNKKQHHNGIDIAAPIGTPIYAAESGKVVAVGNLDKKCPGSGYGKFAVIEHHNNLSTLYAHLSLYIVALGQEVKRGEIIGYMGRTGWSTGPHLHFTVYSSATFFLKPSKSCGLTPVGGDLDPRPYLSM